MNGKEIVALLKDWQVALLVILLIVSVIAIFPHTEDGKFTTNVQYGLDLQDGSWLQMEFQAGVVGFETDRPLGEFVANLSERLDAEIIVLDKDKLEIRKPVTRDELEPIFAASGGTITSFEAGVSKETAEQVKKILENKLNSLGTRDAKVNPLIGMNGVSRYVRVELAGVSLSQAKEIVGKQGKFEIRIHTTGNETEHVLFGDVLSTIGVPQLQPPDNKMWGISFGLSEDGANQFRNAAIKAGATTNPANHNIDMLLDDRVVYSAPLSDDLAASLQARPIGELVATTGTGQAGLEQAQNLEIHLRAGALPVEVTVAGSGYVPAALSDYFRLVCMIMFILAAIAVGIVIYYRYREASIVLPMMGVNLSEIVILVGIAAIIGQQLDLAAIAGLIAVLGTGIDQLVIITDEVLHEGRVPSPSLYKKRLTRAVGIIVVSAATVVIAMLPLALMDLSSLRGFAIITILGVLIGVLITRPAYGKIIMAILAK